MTTQLLAALSWDPEIRGALIVLTSFIILCGSVYLLLATNVGSKVGFLLAAAGLTGWMAAMAWVWVIYGIGIKGDPPTWKVTDVVTGPVQQSTGEETATFPDGWRDLSFGDAIFADATSAADKVLAPSSGGEDGGHGEGGEPSTDRVFEPPFESGEDYVVVGGNAKGGEDYFIPGGAGASKRGVCIPGTDWCFTGWFHKPHYVVVQAQPVIPVPAGALGSAPARPEPDPTQPPTYVVMVRDLGTVRLPSTLVATSMSIVFALVAVTLHRRDKEIMLARAAPSPATG